MEDDVLFSETQRFKQWWLWALLIGINGMLIFGIVKQVFLGQQFGTKPASNAELMVIFGVQFFLTALFLSFKLDTRIKNDGIYFRFYPFHSSYRYQSFDALKKCYVRKYSPILEYGGWGLRFGSMRERAFNVSGNMGLQLQLHDNKKILIGTKRPEQITTVLKEIGEWKE